MLQEVLHLCVHRFRGMRNRLQHCGCRHVGEAIAYVPKLLLSSSAYTFHRSLAPDRQTDAIHGVAILDITAAAQGASGIQQAKVIIRALQMDQRHPKTKFPKKSSR